jgi:hypothetical protein
MKMYTELDVWFHIFIILALDGGRWSASCPSLFTHREQTLVTTG